MEPNTPQQANPQPEAPQPAAPQEQPAQQPPADANLQQNQAPAAPKQSNKKLIGLVIVVAILGVGFLLFLLLQMLG